jgi:hypothetical protein
VKDILEYQRAFVDAELHARVDRLASLLTEDFRSIGEQGFVLGKRQWIDRFGDFRYLSLEVTELDVRSYDRTAIITCVQHSRATWLGQEMSLSTRVGQVWVGQSAEWQLANIQFSSLPTPPP